MVIKTFKIFSYCNDFDEKEDEELLDELSSGASCDSYITRTAYTLESLNRAGYADDPLARKLVELGAEDGEEVLIHLDW